MKLNARQKSFCEFYVASGNATDAAIKAGYKEKNARFIGSENLDILNKMDGEYTQKVEVNGNINSNPFNGLTTDELKEIIKN